MKYNGLGKTGLLVSEIGLGCEGLIGKTQEYTTKMFDYAIENGVNCMDLYSPNPDMQRKVGIALGERRKDFIIQGHLCTIWHNHQYKVTRNLDLVKMSFAEMMDNLGTDYIDVGMIHFVDSLDTWNEIRKNGILDYARHLKAVGVIRHIGLSSHNPYVALEAAKAGEIEVLMFSVNPCYDLLPGEDNYAPLFYRESYQKPLLNLDPKREELYETCQRVGVGITVMKAFGGGDLLSQYSPAGRALTVAQCIHYALTRPGVATVLSGVHTLEQLAESIAYENAAEEERDYAEVFASFPKISWEGHCMYCGHCAPCPKYIEVANVTKYLNLSKAQGEVPETVREHYAALKAHAGECVECGACESRCPFKVPIIKNMREAKGMFGY